MNTEFIETVTRVTNSITRIPDRLSTPDGESARAQFARIFGDCIAAGVVNSDGLCLYIPFQASLLTDPIMYATQGALVVLDHPITAEQFEFAMSKVHIIPLPRKQSLYHDRHPRLIYIPTDRSKSRASWMCDRLRRFEFRGPFAEEML